MNSPASSPCPVSTLAEHRVRPCGGAVRYPEIMTQRGQDIRDETEQMLAAAGIVVTDEGRARARSRLRAAEERMTPEAWERLDERYHHTDAA